PTARTAWPRCTASRSHQRVHRCSGLAARTTPALPLPVRPNVDRRARAGEVDIAPVDAAHDLGAQPGVPAARQPEARGGCVLLGLAARPRLRAGPAVTRGCSPADRGEPRGAGTAASAFDDVDGETSAGRLLVLDLHVLAGLAHRLDDLVQRDEVGSVAAQRYSGRGDRLDRGDRVALDA